ncbi:ATPase [uncultured Marinobacter sp.]|uniref:ATPase n=1 Tax=uncultured Marinobacter sp. TaxID=187379 RepID=UPI0030DC5C18
MEIKTFEDLIEWVRLLHSHLASSMKGSVAGNGNEQARALLTYLSDHEQELTRITREFERQADTKALQTRLYDYIEHKPINRGPTSDTHYATMSYDEICAEIFHFHDEVIALYKALASKAEIPEAKALMEELQEMEEHQAMRLATQTGSGRDL